jgi:hypothetical protein
VFAQCHSLGSKESAEWFLRRGREAFFLLMGG